MTDEPERGTEGAKSSPPRAAGTVVVVEDNDNDATLLKLMFRRSRILNPLQVIDSLHDAICYLKGEGKFADRLAHPFPMMLMIDSHLGDGSGFDLMRWLCENRAHVPSVVVMLTGSDVPSFELSYALGAQSFLTKPLKFEDFKNMVERVRGIKLTTRQDGHLLEPDS